MKWFLLKFLLIVIFAVAKYQGVTGFPRNVPDHTEWHREETHTSLEDINMEVEDLIKSHLNSRRERALNFFHFPIPTLNESLDFLSIRLKILKNSYDRTRENLENIIKKYGFENYTRKDKEQQVNTAQVASTLAASIDDRQPCKSCRLINNPFKDVPTHIINYLSIKMELLKLTYEEMIENFQDIINYVKNRVTKDKDTKDQPENTVSGNKTQVDVTQTTSTPITSRPTTSRPTTPRPTTSRPTTSRPTTSTNESVDNQQSTSNENDDKKDKFENHKETSGSSEKGDKHTESNNAKDKDQSTFENIAMSGDNAAETISTQDESVNQPISSQSVPSKNDEEEKFEDNKESMTSESTASNNETQENSIQIHPTSNESKQNENFEDVEDMAFFL